MSDNTQVEALKATLTEMSLEDNRTIMRWIASDEIPRKEAAAKADKANAQLVHELQQEGHLPAPEVLPAEQPLPADVANIPAWKDPGTNHALMYHKGDRVRYNGKVVRSTHDGLNHWEPTTLNLDGRIWEEEIMPEEEVDQEEPPAEEEPEPPTAAEWVQPTGAHDAYQTGDTVLYDGTVYRSTIDNNTWSPVDYPTGWTAVA